MPIEIKQLLIKSNIVHYAEDEDVEALEAHSAFKEELLNECRHLILEMLREKGER
ncbi:DUF5908 family protein [Nitrosomonas sp.]|uniref:DUF5908 family protein n=1 Tax=Nitrosomonas sp. TaxID=42353 RepID=UPI00208A7AC8|nr:DUF5908 family protein [Nitrosomonas sp.]GJL74688.1 MAG: hypothetical protein NMNS02_07940 [Nitrosomonas sp.]